MVSQVEEVPAGFKLTELGILPADWETFPLGELFEIKQGKSLSAKQNLGINPRPFLRTANVFWGRIDLSTIDKMDFDEAEIRQLCLKQGDLLVCEGGDIGRTAIWKGELDLCCYQNHLHRLRPLIKGVDPLFYMYWMQEAILQLGFYIGSGNKTTIPNLSQSRLKAFLLPKPEYEEQRTIARVLSTIQRAIEAQDKVISAARELKKSLMRHLFTYGPVPISEVDRVQLKDTEIGMIPDQWALTKIGDHSYVITKGSSPNWQGFQYCDTGVIFVRSQNIGEGQLDLVDVVYLPHEFNEKEKRSIIKQGDLLINIVGASIGRAAVADDRIDGGNLNQAISIVRLKASFKSKFLMYFILGEKGQVQLHTQKKDIARANLSLQDIGNIIIPFPATAEQNEITTVFLIIDRKIQSEENRKASLQTLFKTMLHLLMTGQLRVNDLKVDD